MMESGSRRERRSSPALHRTPFVDIGVIREKTSSPTRVEGVEIAFYPASYA